MITRAELQFHREMLVGTDRLKREIGYRPIRFHQMVDEHGGPEVMARAVSFRGFVTHRVRRLA